MSHPINTTRTQVPGRDYTLLGTTPVVYHCNHYNLWHDQTVDDICGEELGTRIRMEASREAFGQLLRDAVSKADLPIRADRFQFISSVFPWMGHGRVAFDFFDDKARGDHLHYGWTWREKYGEKVARQHPADAVAAGFVAAAAEIDRELPAGTIEVHERACFATRAGHCDFDIRTAPPSARPAVVDGDTFVRHSGEPDASLGEDQISGIAAGLREFLSVVGGNEHGLIPAFGVYVTMHLPNYYCQTAYEAIRHIEAESLAHLETAEALLAEGGQVCVFNTIGGILRSPEWASMVGPLEADEFAILSHCCAVSRSLGFGHWSIAEHTPGQRLVLRATSNYESPFWLTRYGASARPRGYFLKGAALASMLLANERDWMTAPALNNDLYLSLFRRKDLGWKATQTKCPTMGDAVSEIVVERA